MRALSRLFTAHEAVSEGNISHAFLNEICVERVRGDSK